MKRITLHKRDTRRDTFRCGGPGGQHQNKTESGVRYTHEPTGLFAASRSDRSQHANDAIAWKMLQAKLDEMVDDANKAALRLGYECKPEVSFGSQIRSYVLDRDTRVVDHRTGHSDPNVRMVVGRGKIEGFLRATMLARAGH